MAYNPKRNDYIDKYKSDHYKRVAVDFKKSYYDETLKPAADSAGVPVASYIKEAVSEKINRDNDAG